MPTIIDLCCGGRSFWFNPCDPSTVYGDRRRETITVTDQSHGKIGGTRQAAIYITAVIILSRHTPLARKGDAQALKALKASIRKAYPFGERAMHPYKAWLDEVKAQLAEVAGGKRPLAVEDIRYKLIGSKPPEEK